jgi:hypothetical protein
MPNAPTGSFAELIGTAPVLAQKHSQSAVG